MPRRVFDRLLRTIGRFLLDRRGGTAMFLAFAIVPLVGFIGMATDTARAFLVKSRLSSALDSAALAGGRAFFRDDRDQIVLMFFDANFPDGYMDATLSGPAIAVDAQNQKLTLDASASIRTSFMRLFGFETLTVTGMSEVTRQMQALDVVLAMDMSGSMGSWMGGTTRIGAARAAATELVEILFGHNDGKDLLAIGLVPWNGKVNVTLDGTWYDPSLTQTVSVPTYANPEVGTQSALYQVNNSPVPLMTPPTADWQGCVFNRYADDGLDDNDADVFDIPGTYGGADWPGWEPVGPEGEPTHPGVCAMSSGYTECTPCLDHGVTPLQNEKATILDAIAALQNPTGVTNIPGGLGWAWRVLSPGSPFTEAEADPDYKLQRAIVLLTDGENVRGYGDGYKRVLWPSGMDARLLTLATRVKSSGVTIYVIQFANDGTDLQDLLKQVASGPDSPFYHYAPDAEALRAVFEEVANDLSELRLSR